jgi:hypothetical protein
MKGFVLVLLFGLAIVSSASQIYECRIVHEKQQGCRIQMWSNQTPAEKLTEFEYFRMCPYSGSSRNVVCWASTPIGRKIPDVRTVSFGCAARESEPGVMQTVVTTVHFLDIIGRVLDR